MVALIAIGPKDMPVAIRTVTGMIKKARRMAAEFQTHVDEMVREADLDEVQADLQRDPQLRHPRRDGAHRRSGRFAAQAPSPPIRWSRPLRNDHRDIPLDEIAVSEPAVAELAPPAEAPSQPAPVPRPGARPSCRPNPRARPPVPPPATASVRRPSRRPSFPPEVVRQRRARLSSHSDHTWPTIEARQIRSTTSRCRCSST